MMKKPTATIAITFRNPGAAFLLALQSVFAQTFADWELILCNDGSDDGSTELALSLSDRRVRVLDDGLSKTLAIRLNQMASIAAGEFLFRMDADDVMHPDRMQKQLAILTNDPDCVVGSVAYAIDAASNITGLKRPPKPGAGTFGARHFFYHPTIAARTEWFRRNPYNETPPFYRSEDAELYCRRSGLDRFVRMEEPLMYIREVGVFSITKYLGTGLGVLNLAQQYGRTKWERFYLTSVHLAKLWLMCGLDTVGKADWIVRRRGIPMDASASAKAAEGLTRVYDTILPFESKRPLCEEEVLSISGAGGLP
jgi:glycosyltransferase involved in cell wall biosynthesis